MQGVPPEEERFAKNVTILAQAAQESAAKLWKAGYRNVSPQEIQLAASVLTALDKAQLICAFIKTSRPYWPKILARDEGFFLHHAAEIFSFLPAGKVDLFKELCVAKDAQGKAVVPEGVKREIWELFAAMVKICIKYVHRERRAAPGAACFPEIDLAQVAQAWGVSLAP